MTLQVELVTPEKLLFSESASIVEVPGTEGDLGILAEHAPLISQLRPGVVEITTSDNAIRKLFVAGGFVEVTANRCTILAEEALSIAEIKAEEVKERLSSAQRNHEHAKDEAAKIEAEKSLAVAEAMADALAKK